MTTEIFTDPAADHCRKLWQSVVLLACQDALMDGAENIKERDKARAWLRGNSRDFRMVCELAGLDPGFVRQSYLAGRIDAKKIGHNQRDVA